LVLKNILIIFKTVKDFRPDILLLEGPNLFSAISVILKKLYGIPMAVMVRGDGWQQYAEIDHDVPVYEKLSKLLNFKAGQYVLKNSDAIFPLSNNLKKIVEKNLKVDKLIQVVNITYKELDKDNDKKPELPENFVLTVTNFNYWAKVEPLLHAIKLVSPVVKESGWTWIILGDGFFYDSFKQALNDEVDWGTVKLLGRQNPYPFYKSAKALFYISGMDALPNVLLESFLYKLPVVINRDCPAVEFVLNNNGFVINFDDLQAVRDMIRHLKEDREAVSKVAEKAHNYVTKQFSVENVSGQLENALHLALRACKSK
jgi:glycosyltransferase involved in cell wall biosynthesis